MSSRLVLVVLLVSVCVALCCRMWAADGRIPKVWVARRLVPLVLAGIGLCGLVLSWSNTDPFAFAHLHGIVPQEASWRSALLLQSCHVPGRRAVADLRPRQPSAATMGPAAAARTGDRRACCSTATMARPRGSASWWGSFWRWPWRGSTR